MQTSYEIGKNSYREKYNVMWNTPEKSATMSLVLACAAYRMNLTHIQIVFFFGLFYIFAIVIRNILICTLCRFNVFFYNKVEILLGLTQANTTHLSKEQLTIPKTKQKWKKAIKKQSCVCMDVTSTRNNWKMSSSKNGLHFTFKMNIDKFHIGEILCALAIRRLT